MHLCPSGEEAGRKWSGKIDGGRTPVLLWGSLGRPSIFFGVREVADLKNSKQKGQRLGPLTMTGQCGVSPADGSVSKTCDNLMFQIFGGIRSEGRLSLHKITWLL